MPKPLTPARVQQIVKRWRPKGYRLIWDRRRRAKSFWHPPTGLYNPSRRTIAMAPITNPDTLCAFLHECAHARLKHGHGPVHLEEWEAEHSSLDRVRKYGYRVSLSYRLRTFVMLGRYIRLDRRNGVPIDPRVTRWIAWRA